MFLKTLIERNPRFLGAACALHREGRIPAGCFALDLDAVEANARVLSSAAAKLGLTVFGMTKQFGRHADALDAACRGGIGSFVAVDMACARAVRAAGRRLGHLGHLVQVPRAETGAACALDPDYWTLYSLDKALECSAACVAAGRTQKVLMRVRAEGDVFYRNQEGGFPAETLARSVAAVRALPGLDLRGFVTFPAQLFDQGRGEVEPTHNLGTLARVRAEFASALGGRPEINAPGTTSAATLARLAEAGATQVEPGHALTGTTPLHAVRDLPEIPAMLYLSEVSHEAGGESFFYGGGLYADPVFAPYPLKALCGDDPETIGRNAVPAEIPPDSMIDYHGMLKPEGGRRPATGDTVILGFRAQAFVCRAPVVGIRGVSTGSPSVASLRGPDGRVVEWP